MTEAYPRPAVTAVLSVADMRRSDAYTIEHFTDSKTLMARAGQGLFEACKWHGRVPTDDEFAAAFEELYQRKAELEG